MDPREAKADLRLLTKSLSSLKITHLQVELLASFDTFLPSHTGNLLRGTLGAALKAVSPHAYDVLYDSHHHALIHDQKVLDHAKTLPHPILIRPQNHSVPFIKATDSLCFDILLFGEAAPTFFSVLVDALSLMASRGLGKKRHPFKLLRVVECYPLISQEHVLYYHLTQGFCDTPVGHRASDYIIEQSANDIWIHFVSPAQIIDKGKVQYHIAFDLLVRTIMRRLTTLNSAYAVHDIAINYRQIVEYASTIQMRASDTKRIYLERYSGTQKRATPQRGVQGLIHYQGEGLSDFMPLLSLARAVHIGKTTLFGFGHYSIYFERPHIEMKVIKKHKHRQDTGRKYA